VSDRAPASLKQRLRANMREPARLRGPIRQRFEALADRYCVDRDAMWHMTVGEFAEAIEAAQGIARSRTGTS